MALLGKLSSMLVHLPESQAELAPKFFVQKAPAGYIHPPRPHSRCPPPMGNASLSNAIFGEDEEDLANAAPISILVPHITAYCATHGIVMVSKKDVALIHHAPVSLRPAPMPRSLFVAAVDLAGPFNLLVDAISRDEQWLLTTLKGVLADPFTDKLVALYRECGGAQAKQPLSLGIHRSDYMIDAGNGGIGLESARLRQIELNTISASFACLSTRVAAMHRFLLNGPGLLNGVDLGLPGQTEEHGALDNHLPVNSAEVELAAALAKAHQSYPASKDLTGVVAFVVQEGERNEFDQRHLEFTLFANHQVHVKRLTLGEIAARCKLDDDDQDRLVLDDKFEITVAYFRAAYRPEDLPTEREWEARALLERSLAIKCPSVGYHLAGTKKVQQALAAPGAVERFLPAPLAAQVRACFAGLWSLGEDADQAVIRRAKESPEGFVLKPQREGGGNNYYGADVKAKLESMSPEELAAHILMERVFPPAQPVSLLREGVLTESQGISELGIYSVFLGNGTTAPLLNKSAGHLLRTKLVGVDEGGVASGFACLDSPFLI